MERIQNLVPVGSANERKDLAGLAFSIWDCRSGCRLLTGKCIDDSNFYWWFWCCGRSWSALAFLEKAAGVETSPAGLGPISSWSQSFGLSRFCVWSVSPRCSDLGSALLFEAEKDGPMGGCPGCPSSRNGGRATPHFEDKYSLCPSTDIKC